MKRRHVVLGAVLSLFASATAFGQRFGKRRNGEVAEIADNGRALSNGWHQGPPSEKLYYWGAVVLKEDLGNQPYLGGFYFAEFAGDKVIVHRGKPLDGPVERPLSDIAYYNNSLDLPFYQRKS